MKTILFCIFNIISINSFSQYAPGKIDSSKINSLKIASKLIDDTSFKFIHKTKSQNGDLCAYFINNKLVDASLLNSLDPELFENINSSNEAITINDKLYKQQVFIKMKTNYGLNIVTLTDIKLKYVHQKNKPVVFMIDGELIDYDYNKYQIDENYLLTISVDSLKNQNENIDFTLVKILTRSKRNLDDRKKIQIRGTNN